MRERLSARKIRVDSTCIIISYVLTRLAFPFTWFHNYSTRTRRINTELAHKQMDRVDGEGRLKLTSAGTTHGANIPAPQ